MKLSNSSLIKNIILIGCLVWVNSCKFSDAINPEIIIPTPTLLSPAKSAIDVSISPTLTWNASPDAISYSLQVSTDSLFSSFVFNQSGLTSTSRQLTGLSNLTTYYWHVNVTNNSGTSDWSKPLWRFTTTGSAPGEPLLSSPVNNTTGISTSPVLAWNASPGALSYTLQVSTNNSFSNNIVYNQGGLTGTNQTVTGLNYSTTYYWRVSATNNYGSSGWSTSVWSFTTVGPPPNAPTLLSPTNDSIDQSTTLTLTWYPSPGTTIYTLQVSTNSSFSSFVHNQTSITGTSLQISGLSNLTKYYWRVSASNSNGTSTWSSPIWAFTTIGSAPFAPILSSPPNNSIDISTSPVLEWNTSAGATSYALQISTNSSFSSTVYNQNGLTGISQQINGLGISTTFYWRVSAGNNYGISSWSAPWSFTTRCVGTISYLGKNYNVVQIGKQCWLKENLDVGIRINKGDNQTNNGVIEKYCYEDNESANCTKFGGLYQWDEAMQYVTTEKAQGICPFGWHIPTRTEFETLIAFVNNDGNKLKAVGEGIDPGTGTNTSGFSALLAGYGYENGNNGVGFALSLGFTTYFWSSSLTQGNDILPGNFNIYFNHPKIVVDYNYKKNNAFSIRCIKD
jgi:uncharacterized protein (TIGR02145 family)